MKEIPAYQLIQKSHTLNINHSDADTFELQSGIEDDDFDINSIAVSLYADNENYTFEYHFTKQNLIDSRIEDNIIFFTGC